MTRINPIQGCNAKYRPVLTLFFFFVAVFSSEAQQVSKNLVVYQDSLNKIVGRVLSAQSDEQKFTENGLFVKTLVDALKTQNSFNFSFDSLKSVSVIKSPDKAIRLLTWYVKLSNGKYRYFGAVQLNTSSGVLNLSPLIDQTENLIDPNITTTNKNWFGAKYYEIVPVTSSGRPPYYVLLGWKGNDDRTTKRVIEILTINKSELSFGANVFDGKELTAKNRLIFEYNKQNAMTLKFDLKAGVIVVDHLSPVDPEMNGKFEYYGSDGRVDGFKIIGGRLKFQENLELANAANDNDPFYIDPNIKKKEN